MKKIATSGYFLVILSALGFSFKSVLVKTAYEHGVDSMTLMLMRMFVALPFFFAALLIVERENAFKIRSEDLLLFSFMGIAGIGCAMFFSFYSLELIDASLATLVAFTYPAMTLLMLICFFKERATLSKVLSGLVTFSGLILVIRLDKVDFLAMNGKGIMLGLISAFSYAVYNVLSEKIMKNISPIKVISYSMFFMVAFFGLFFGNRVYPTDIEVWSIASVLGIFTGFLPFFFYIYGMKKIGAAKAVIFSSISPIFTVLLAYLFLNEQLDGIQLLGMGVMIGGVILLKLRNPLKIMTGTEEEIKNKVSEIFNGNYQCKKTFAVVYIPKTAQKNEIENK